MLGKYALILKYYQEVRNKNEANLLTNMGKIFHKCHKKAMRQPKNVGENLK
jgi:hypothetical protein